MKEEFKEGLKHALEEEYVTRGEVTAANAVMKEKVQDYCSKYTHAAAALDPASINNWGTVEEVQKIYKESLADVAQEYLQEDFERANWDFMYADMIRQN